jgi:N-acetylneuraminic acid mutarotase
MLAVRTDAPMLLLPNGMVLVAGGATTVSGAPGSIASAELYNPVSASWSATGSMNVARAGATGVVLPNGEVLVSGGAAADGTPLSSAELYDPASGAWTLTGSMGDARVDFPSVVLQDGRVLVAGGSTVFGSAEDSLSSVEIYAPANGTWTQAADMSVARAKPAATSLPDGRVLVIGGANAGQALSSAEYFDLTASFR